VEHPQVGELELRYDTFAIADADNQVLVVYQAEQGSRSAESLVLLSTIAGSGSGPLVAQRRLEPDHSPGGAVGTTADTQASGRG